MEIIDLCLDGFKSAIKIVCVFDLELQRNAFVTTLAKFTFLNNLGEMKTKNMEAIKTLLDIAVTEGNNLKSSWHEVLTCVSQLEQMQLISSGVDVSDTGKKGFEVSISFVAVYKMIFLVVLAKVLRRNSPMKVALDTLQLPLTWCFR